MEELAEASGVSVRAIGDMERGHSRVPQRRTVVALTEGLGRAGGASDARGRGGGDGCAAEIGGGLHGARTGAGTPARGRGTGSC
ncbi:helix-turn-helix domain-containing protein [Streptomyces sp. NPDC056121]|uniref:helix-turn-helix domain-containing protein n=1 Tax=Streptomyces sp. NPDC056121 TaxID=3345718 RepID=UPI0035E26640